MKSIPRRSTHPARFQTMNLKPGLESYPQVFAINFTGSSFLNIKAKV